jgi:ketosteroid isomerase-like protein
MNDADQLIERTQHVILLLCSILFTAFLLPAQAANCPGHQGKEPEILIQIEQSWAAALELRDADAVGCILADEFQDVDPSGALHARAETLAQIPNRRPGKNVLSELSPHVFGDFGYIRGLATLVDAQGSTIARVRFTDIYIYRDNRWLALAGQESMLPATAK